MKLGKKFTYISNENILSLRDLNTSYLDIRLLNNIIYELRTVIIIQSYAS